MPLYQRCCTSMVWLCVLVVLVLIVVPTEAVPRRSRRGLSFFQKQSHKQGAAKPTHAKVVAERAHPVEESATAPVAATPVSFAEQASSARKSKAAKAKTAVSPTPGTPAGRKSHKGRSGVSFFQQKAQITEQEDPPAADADAPPAGTVPAETTSAAEQAEATLKELAGVLNEADGVNTPPHPYELPSGMNSMRAIGAADYSVDVPKEIVKSDAALAEVDHQIELDVTTAQEWYNLIQNYQFKYTSLLQRIRLNKKKAADMRRAGLNLKGAATHNDITKMLSSVQAQLGTLVATTDGEDYSKFVSEIGKIKAGLGKMNNDVQKTINTAPQELRTLSAGPVPPRSADLLKHLVATDDKNGKDAALVQVVAASEQHQGEEEPESSEEADSETSSSTSDEGASATSTKSTQSQHRRRRLLTVDQPRPVQRRHRKLRRMVSQN